jgi:hypothetical protein
VSRRIYELCEWIPHDEPSINPLNTLALTDFIIAITFVARCQRNISWATGRPSNSIKLNNRELHDLYTRSYGAFDDWPINFFRFLNGGSPQRSKLRPRDGKLDTALKREFGSFYESLYQHLDGAQFDFLRNAFCQFLTGRFHSQSATPVERSRTSRAQESATYISLSDARRSLKITNTALFSLIEAGEIRCAIVNGRRTPEFAVTSGDVERIRFELEEAVTCRELARELGVDCKAIREHVRKELIRPLVRRSTGAFNTLRFGRIAAADFVRCRS